MTVARRRVAITGIGLVTPVGNDVAATWDALLEGRSGGAAISLFDASAFPVRIAAEVKHFDAGELAGERKLLKYADRSHRFALVAAEQAFRDAGVRPTPATATRWGSPRRGNDDLRVCRSRGHARAQRGGRRTARGGAADRCGGQ
jgi:3-oxoacyl-(acyl-carrier-protein) synthase